MKFKYYLRGLGIGIIFAVIIMTVGAKNSSQMSDEEILKRAAELGMVEENSGRSGVLKSSDDTENTEIVESVYNTESTENVSDKKSISDTESVEKSNNTADNANSHAKNNTDGSNEAEGDGDNNDSNNADAINEKITVTISGGAVCRSVAQMLFDAQLVDDAESFRIYMGQSGYADTIHPGTYELQKGMTYEEIAKIIAGN